MTPKEAEFIGKFYGEWYELEIEGDGVLYGLNAMQRHIWDWVKYELMLSEHEGWKRGMLECSEIRDKIMKLPT